ncbi:MAG: transglycosylase domain-containing protein [Clostridia bacterium]|nr:transglycosylase domain-containing protein [Clostridia bacterium]
MIKRIFGVFLKLILILFIILTIVAIVVGIALAIYIDKSVEKEINEELFYIVGSDSETKIYYYEYEDRENRIGEARELIGEKLYGGYRCKYVRYDSIPQNLKNAFISIEDKRFEEHKGVDWLRTVSAGLNYYLKFSDSFGGSTITQQLIKNVTEKDDYTFQRKIQEIFWALDLETKMDKREILSLYLNIINLSQGCYGVGAASEYYFSKSVSELSLSECACIAAITNSPTYYDPIRNPENNEKRRNLILEQMYEQGYITEDEYNDALNDKIQLNVMQSSAENGVNSWYVDMVINDVMKDLMAEYGYSRTMASLIVYTGGLEIYTVMDMEIQEILEEYYKKTENFSASEKSELPQSSMIIIDNSTGDILGVAGAVGDKSANRIQNYATDTVRPAGSVIKPLSTYAPAVENGIITWSTVYDDTPVNFGSYNLDPEKGKIVEPVAWPKNANGIYRGLTNINYAIEHSINTVTVKVLESLGLDTSFNFLYDKLRIKSLIYSATLENGAVITDKDYAALALGQFNYGATVREVSAAYSIFANDGIYNDYRSYYKVTDQNGDIVLDKGYHGEAVISKENSDVMTMMLENVVKNGTAKDITLDKYIDCAGKTGTTQNKNDLWYIGYTPYMIGGVWLGYEYPTPLNAYQTNKCIEIWDEVMTLVHKKYIDEGNVKSFSVSDNVVKCSYCVDSGKLMTNACQLDPRGDRSETGYFVKGTEPSDPCDKHLVVNYDTINGGVVIGNCPTENTIQIGLINVERSFPMQIYITDAQYAWRNIGYDVLPETSPSLPFYNNLLPQNSFCGISKVEAQYNRACREHFNYFEWKKKQEESG